MGRRGSFLGDMALRAAGWVRSKVGSDRSRSVQETYSLVASNDL